MKDIFIDDELHEECGVFGVINVENASEVIYYGLHALQHRGQEGAGMIVTDGKELSYHKGEGLVTDVFKNNTLSELKGSAGIGHVRYSTTGGGGLANVQPFLFQHNTGDFGLCHNGNLVNYKELRMTLERSGSILQSKSDSEIFAHLIKRDTQPDRMKAIKDALNQLEGAFAFLVIENDKLLVMRDKNSLRPLSLAKLNGGFVVSSETCAFDTIGATFLRDIKPGEILIIDKDNHMTSDFYAKKQYHNMCAMEYIYFSRPDSNIDGINVHAARKETGRQLARESYVDADVVIWVPDSSTSAALGYAEESGIPAEMGLIKNKYVGRTFIQPSQAMRDKGVKMKLSPVRGIVEGRRVVVVDDSIVRGTTSRKIVEMLREFGAKEVHFRIAAPEINHPCFYGVDISTFDELISAHHTKEEVREIIGADSLAYLSMAGLKKSIGREKMCTSCFTGKYPTYIYGNIKDANKDGKF